MPDRVAILDDGSIVELFASDDPSVWFALSSDGKTRYRITGVWTANPHCTCPFRARESNPTQLCRHMRGIITMVLEEHAMAEQSTSLVPAEPKNSIALTASINANNSLEAVKGQVMAYRYALEFCDMYVAEAGVPQRFGTKGAMAACLLRAAELGVPFGLGLELMYVVNGSPAIQGQMVAALITRAGGRIEIIDSTAEACTITGHRPGWPPYTVTWTKDDAKSAGTPSKDDKPMGGWKDKLVWKATARIGRRMFPDVLGGLDVGDGAGQIIDYAVVPEQANEYKVEAPAERPAIAAAPAAPAAEAPVLSTTQQIAAALKAKDIKANVLLDFLSDRAGNPLAREAIVDATLAYTGDNDCTIADLATDAAAWHAAGRPPVVGRDAAPAELEFDEGEWRDPAAPAEAVESPTQADIFAGLPA